jgi:hypothetical protein
MWRASRHPPLSWVAASDGRCDQSYTVKDAISALTRMAEFDIDLADNRCGGDLGGSSW